MQRLRGAFSGTPIERANIRPFLDIHLARKKARLHRIVRKGLAPPGDKASLRAMGEQAIRDRDAAKPQDQADRRR